ncbi:MAG TPA: acyltransferase family protein [Acidimicrobiales bacterium]|nr:acyltransferase family protein [Acidimicrobiales bacterium]
MDLQTRSDARGPGTPATAEALPPRGIRRPDIQGLRAVAVLLVVAFHAGLRIPGGFVGVDVFFVISGFVITSLLVAEVSRTERLDFASFYSRRVRRILPALAVTITLVAIGAVFVLSPLGPQQQTAHTGAAAAVMGANIQLYQSPVGYFDVSSVHNALLHTWSLSVEEQFYLAFPAILLAAWVVGRRRGGEQARRRTAAIVLTVVGVASFVLCVALTDGHTFGGLFASPQQWAFYGAPARAWEFCAGALVAFAATRAGRLRPVVAVVVGGVGALFIAAAALALGSTTAFPGTAALLPVGGAVLLIVAGFAAPDEGFSRWLSNRSAVWIGDRSYGWYLWHWPAIVFVRAIWPGHLWIDLLAALASLVAAHVSFVLLEDPLRARRDLTGRRVLPLAAVCVVVPLVTCLSIAPMASAFESPATKALVASQALHADYLRGCDSSKPFADRPPDCTWRVAHPEGTVVLLGDSNAGQLTEAAAEGANEEGYDLEAVTMSSCPFVDLEVIRYGQDQRDCTTFVTKSLPQIVAAHPNLVVLALSSAAYLPNTHVALRDPTTGVLATDQPGKAKLWTTSIRRVVERLTRAGIPVVFVHTIPQFDWYPVDCGIRAYGSPLSCGLTVSRSQAEADRRYDFRAEEAAVAGVPHTTEVDLIDDVCSPSACTTYRDGVWWYRDGGHLSVAASKLLGPRLGEIVREGVGA